MRTVATLVLVIAALAAERTTAQAPEPVPSSPAPAFEVVSIRRNAGRTPGTATQRPDGGFTFTGIPVASLIARAYPVASPDMVNLPEWARSERYDVSATSPLPRPTAEERAAMMRALLTDRFKLVAHIEQREQPVYDLVLARPGGALGPGLTRVGDQIDCEARTAADRAAAEAALAAGKPAPRPEPPDLNATPPPCTIFMPGSRMEGQITMTVLASVLRSTTGRPVVDKTGLEGMYRVSMEYDRLAGVRGPAPADTPGAPPSVFTALPEQLGLRLEPSRGPRAVLVIDRLERPTEN